MRKLTIFIFWAIIFFLSPQKISASVTITIQNVPLSAIKTEEFNVLFTVLKDPPSPETFAVKGRIGSASASLNQGETFNSTSNSWLSDNDSWSNFPTVSLDNNGIATSTVRLRTKTSAFIGENLLIVRVRQDSTNYDSSASALLVLEPSPTPTILPSPSPTPSPTLIPTVTETPTPQPTPVSYNNIYLSEAMVSPETGENEWVEIYNDNDFLVSLKNWFVDDLENAGSSPKIFSLEIAAKSYGVFNLSSSMFNNDGDSVRLLDFNKNLKDSFEYQNANKGKSYARVSLDNDTFCLQEPSKSSTNNACLNPTPVPTPTSQPTLKPTKTPTPTTKPTASLLTSTNIDNPPFSFSIETDEGEVLSVQDEVSNPYEWQPFSDAPKLGEPRRLVKGLMTSSLFISFLNIFYVLLKIKKLSY